MFLFDEPLSNLDAMLRVQMRVEIAKLHQDLKTTMIYVTHDQVEAMTLADKIVVLDHGVISQVGTPMDLYNKPANKFVASFIGSPTMNFVAAEAKSASGKDAVVNLPGGHELKLTTQGGLAKPGGVEVGIRRSTCGSAGRTTPWPASAERCSSWSGSATRRSCTSTPMPGRSWCRTTATRRRRPATTSR